MPASDLIQKVITRGKEIISGGVESTAEFARKHPVTSAVTVGGGVLAGITAIQIVRKKSKPSTASKKSRKKSKKKSTKRRGGKNQKQPYTAGKGKDTSTRRIRFTKNNQPYIIMKSGKARFIKKSSVKRMRKLKGGKY